MENLILYGVGVLLTDSNDKGARIIGYVMMSIAVFNAVLNIYYKLPKGVILVGWPC